MVAVRMVCVCTLLAIVQVHSSSSKASQWRDFMQKMSDEPNWLVNAPGEEPQTIIDKPAPLFRKFLKKLNNDDSIFGGLKMAMGRFRDMMKERSTDDDSAEVSDFSLQEKQFRRKTFFEKVADGDFEDVESQQEAALSLIHSVAVTANLFCDEGVPPSTVPIMHLCKNNLKEVYRARKQSATLTPTRKDTLYGRRDDDSYNDDRDDDNKVNDNEPNYNTYWKADNFLWKKRGLMKKIHDSLKLVPTFLNREGWVSFGNKQADDSHPEEGQNLDVANNHRHSTSQHIVATPHGDQRWRHTDHFMDADLDVVGKDIDARNDAVHPVHLGENEQPVTLHLEPV